MLDERKKSILSALIKDFVLTAEPVGSKRLVEQYSFNISPATVRNELALLEEMGYISQPHTSAGRVPTDLGYRYYVDEFAEHEDLMRPETSYVQTFYAELSHEIGQLMRETSHLLSELTQCAALVYAPDIRKERIKHIDLVGLGGQEAMIVIITSTGSLSKRVVDLGAAVDAETLMRFEEKLNDALANVPVELARGRDIPTVGLRDDEAGLLRQVRDHVIDGMAVNVVERVYFGGAANLLEKPEVIALKRAHEVMNLLEQNYRLLEWLQVMSQDLEVVVSIGGENQLNLEGFSLVASGYEVRGEPVGVLGILGPTRMDYPKAMSTVKLIAKNLGAVLAGLQRQ